MHGLPSLTTAKLPANYQAAKRAISNCVRIDECKSWKDKAAALASYAKQADDKELELMARRIKARAVDQMGALLKKIEPKGGQAAKGKSRGSTTPTLSRSEIARRAGLSPDQQKTAMRVANVARAEFERQVESDDPPTIGELARQGTRHDHLKGRDEVDFKSATKVLGLLTYAIEKLPSLDVSRAVAGMNGNEKRRALKQASTLREWLTDLIKKMEK